MSIRIASYNFEGPFRSISKLKRQSGVYSILGRNSVNDQFTVVDVGESQEVKGRVEKHDREDCWGQTGYTTLNCAAYYCNEAMRMVVEAEIRQHYDPPCGKR